MQTSNLDENVLFRIPNNFYFPKSINIHILKD